MSVAGHNLRSVHAAALVTVVICSIEIISMRASHGRESIGRATPTLFTWALIGLLALLFASTLFADGFRLQAGMAFRRLGTGILVALIAREVLDTVERRRHVLVGFLLGSSTAALVGMAQLLRPSTALENLFWGDPTRFGAIERLTLPFGHANVAGSYFAIATVIGAAMIAADRSPTSAQQPIGPAPIAAATVLSTVALSLTFSRSALAGALTGLVVLSSVQMSKRPRSTALMPPAIVAGALILLVAVNPSWHLRLDDPGARHWYAVSIDAPVRAIGGETVHVTVTNDSNERWAGSPVEYVEVAFDGLASEGTTQLELPPLEPGAVTTVSFLTPADPNGRLLIDVYRPGQGRFLRLTGQATTEVVIGPGIAEAESNSTGTTGSIRGPLPRSELWEAATTLSGQRPLTGVGVGNFRLHYQSVTESGRPLTSHAHSAIFEPLASWGVPAAVLFWMLALGSFLRGLRRFDDPVSVAATSGLIVVLIVGLADWVLSSASGGLGFWLLIALVNPPET